MKTISERMELLLGESGSFVESLDSIADRLKEGGLVLTAESPEAYLAGVQEILETYEMDEEVRKELQEFLGTALALGAAGLAGKWMHGKYKNWKKRRADKKLDRDLANAHDEHEREVKRHQIHHIGKSIEAMKASRNPGARALPAGVTIPDVPEAPKPPSAPKAPKKAGEAEA